MNISRFALCALVLGFVAPAWAVNKCTGADGKVSFQDAPCAGEGEKIEVRPAMQGATPIPPSPSAAKEGAFGPAWQRRHYLQNQGVPQARAAIERNQKECAAPPDEAVAQAGPLRRSTLASGSQFAQERAAAASKDKAACDARTEELRGQLRSLEAELGKP
ncbi:MAG: DUF4124 domain-containing protein [Comamonadaceae bacterium]|nr:MAG: DUF4124 domain-containing protein [Comamonadaceae bacterium]